MTDEQKQKLRECYQYLSTGVGKDAIDLLNENVALKEQLKLLGDPQALTAAYFKGLAVGNESLKELKERELQTIQAISTLETRNARLLAMLETFEIGALCCQGKDLHGIHDPACSLGNLLKEIKEKP